jgi:Tfp pilus assembly protein PilF
MEAAYQKKKYSLVAPLLTDPTRAVRSEAARALTEVPVKLFNPVLQEDFEKALDEYKERQDSIADRPEAHLNLGIMYENLGQDDMAEASYKTAIKLVNDFSPARFNLANFYNRKGRNTDAEQQFREIIALEPENGEARYSLGLLLAEMNRLDEAVILMAKAVELMPDRARVRYNYALALSHLGRNEEALSQMIKAYQADHRNPEIVQALVIFYLQDKQLKKARHYAERLVEIAPGAKEPRQMLERIQQAIKNEKRIE